MNDKQLIMTVKELRSLTGKATAHLSDEELAASIVNLDFLADLFIKRVVPRKEKADKLENKR